MEQRHISHLAEAIRNLDARIRELANTKPKLQDWQAAGLEGLWSNVAGFAPASYWKDPHGLVHLRGRVTGGSGVIFTLPTNYRPEYNSRFSLPDAGVIQVNTNGVIEAISGSTLALEGVTVRAFA